MKNIYFFYVCENVKLSYNIIPNMNGFNYTFNQLIFKIVI